jgi:hypothetical protein
MKGFSPTWCEWISKVMSRGSVAVKVNDNIDITSKLGKECVDGIRYLLSFLT